MALNICPNGLPRREYKVKMVMIAKRMITNGAPHTSSQIFLTPEYSEKIR